MITLIDDRKRESRFPIKHFWFAESPKKRHALFPSIYFHCLDTRDHKGFQRQPRWTSLIKLDRDDRELLESFARNTKYEIKRAERDYDTITFRTHSGFSECKARHHPTVKTYAHNLITRELILPNGYVITHKYIADSSCSRIHLYRSSSMYDQVGDQELKNSIGRFNRLLHYADMKHFRDMGFVTYDFGGIAHASAGSKLGNIDKFKQCFRGRLVEESIYISLAIVIYNRLIHHRITRV